MKGASRVPTCPACKAKFQHDGPTMSCRQCGLPDEARDRGAKAIRSWKAAQGIVTRGGSVQRRRRAHGRPRGGSRRVGR